jgi:uncharacterized protein YndB with AHSA1/START domain
MNGETEGSGAMEVQREVTIDASPAEVWEALSEPALMRDWLFDAGEERPLEVDEVEEAERLAFRWRRDGQHETSVVFTLEPVPTGTRVVVVESGLRAPLAAASAAGWTSALSALATVAALALG